LFIRNPNEKGDNEIWSDFTKLKSGILQINSSQPLMDMNLIDEWLKRHEFWYELLPNKVFSECVLNTKNSSFYHEPRESKASSSKKKIFLILILILIIMLINSLFFFN
jgi:hypothetical protein